MARPGSISSAAEFLAALEVLDGDTVAREWNLWREGEPRREDDRLLGVVFQWEHAEPPPGGYLSKEEVNAEFDARWAEVQRQWRLGRQRMTMSARRRALACCAPGPPRGSCATSWRVLRATRSVGATRDSRPERLRPRPPSPGLSARGGPLRATGGWRRLAAALVPEARCPPGRGRLRRRPRQAHRRRVGTEPARRCRRAGGGIADLLRGSRVRDAGRAACGVAVAAQRRHPDPCRGVGHAPRTAPRVRGCAGMAVHGTGVRGTRVAQARQRQDLLGRLVLG